MFTTVLAPMFVLFVLFFFLKHFNVFLWGRFVLCPPIDNADLFFSCVVLDPNGKQKYMNRDNNKGQQSMMAKVGGGMGGGEPPGDGDNVPRSLTF